MAAESQRYDATAYNTTRRTCPIVGERDGGVQMLQRTVSYSSLLRILGGCLLLYGLYLILLALTAQFQEGGSVQYSGPLISGDVMGMEDYLFYGGLFPGNPVLPAPFHLVNMFGVLTPGPLLWVGLGILCMSLTSRRVQVAYVGLQVALWMISVSVWSPILWLLGSTHYGVGAVGPFFLVTLALSLILLALYKPVAHSLSTLLLSSV